MHSTGADTCATANGFDPRVSTQRSQCGGSATSQTNSTPWSASEHRVSLAYEVKPLRPSRPAPPPEAPASIGRAPGAPPPDRTGVGRRQMDLDRARGPPPAPFHNAGMLRAPCAQRALRIVPHLHEDEYRPFDGDLPTDGRADGIASAGILA